MTSGWRDGVTAAATVAGRVLIVGDLALSRGLMRMVLSRLGYVVVCVAGAAEARAALARTPFALALVALRLPDAAGPAFARGLRQAAPAGGAPAPRLLLFGDAWDQEAVLRECGASGLDGYLPKPISISRLVASVRELTRPIFDPARAAAAGGAAGVPPMPQDDAPPPVDLARLGDFTGGDDQIERELASLYLATAGQYLAAMRAALTSGGAWDRPAHALRGASENLGIPAVAALAAEAEGAAPAPELADRLEAALARVRDFFGERGRDGGGAGALRELDLAG